MNKYDFKKFSFQETKYRDIEPKYSFKPTYRIEKELPSVFPKANGLKRAERSIKDERN